MSVQDPNVALLEAEIFPFEVGYLPELFRKKGERELNYNQSVRERTLRQIKEFMEKSSTLEDVQINDETLLLFLTSKKHDVGKTFSKLKKYARFRRDNEIMFTVPPFEVMSPFMTTKFISFLPWRCQDGCAIIVIEVGKFNSEKFSLEAIEQYFVFTLFQSLRDPMTQINGFKVIFDLDCTLEVLKICTPQNLYKLYYGTQVVLPGRFKEIHLVNMGVIGTTIWQIMSLFMSKKIKERVRVHKYTEGLMDYLPKSSVPAKYGGELKDYDMTEWLKRMKSPEKLTYLDF